MEVNDQQASGVPDGWEIVGAEKPIKAGAHPEAKMGASVSPLGRPNVALDPSMVDAMGMQKVVSPEAERFMTTPLVHPTGIDVLDSFLSPASLAMMAPSAVSAVKGAVTGLASSVGAPLAKKVLQFVTPSALKKPAEFVDLVNEIGKAIKNASAAEAPAQPSSGSPAPAAQAMPDQKALNEAAIASRRAAYQASQAAPVTRPAAPIASPAPVSPAGSAPRAATVAADEAALHIVSDRTGHSTVYNGKQYLGSFDSPGKAAEFVETQRAPAAPASPLTIQSDRTGHSTVYDGRKYLGSFDTPAEAQRFVQSQSPVATAADALAAKLGGPADAEVAATVAERNATKRWPTKVSAKAVQDLQAAADEMGGGKLTVTQQIAALEFMHHGYSPREALSMVARDVPAARR